MNVFSTWAIQHFTAGTISWAGKSIGVALLTRAPAEPSPNAPQGVAALARSLGYMEQVDPDYSRTEVQVTSSVSGTTTRVIIGEDYALPEDVEPAFIASAVFFLKGTHDGVVDPWLFVTDTTFNQIVYEGSSLTTRTQTPRILFTYTPRGATVDAAVGGLIRSPGESVWEPPRVQHVFLYPQRVNYAVNPSFEDVGLFGWRANGGITRVQGTPGDPALEHLANHWGAIGGNRLEGLPMSASSGLYRVSGYFRSQGATQIQLGLASWADDWLAPTDLLGRTQSLSDDWTRLDTLIQTADGIAGVGPLVKTNGAFDADLILMENTADLNTYFDGDYPLGFIGAFSWQGTPHQSFSFWYNNRLLVGARLFGEYNEGPVTKKGLVFGWMPEGTPVYTHWDVLSTTDTRQPFQDWGSHTI